MPCTPANRRPTKKPLVPLGREAVCSRGTTQIEPAVRPSSPQQCPTRTRDNGRLPAPAYWMCSTGQLRGEIRRLHWHRLSARHRFSVGLGLRLLLPFKASRIWISAHYIRVPPATSTLLTWCHYALTVCGHRKSGHTVAGRGRRRRGRRRLNYDEAQSAPLAFGCAGGGASVGTQRGLLLPSLKGILAGLVRRRCSAYPQDLDSSAARPPSAAHEGLTRGQGSTAFCQRPRRERMCQCADVLRLSPPTAARCLHGP